MQECRLRRLNQAHRETPVSVQQFSKNDFDRKASAAPGAALDVFAHPAAWNGEARQTFAEGGPVSKCVGMRPDAEMQKLQKVMDEYRQSLESAVSAFQRKLASPDADAVIEQTHENNLMILFVSCRPH